MNNFKITVSNGCNLNITQINEEGAGNRVPVVLLHGGGPDQKSRGPVGQKRSEHQRVILRDLRGFALGDIGLGFSGLGGEATLLDVCLDELLVSGVELAALWHLTAFDHFPEQAVIGFARRDYRPARTALHHTRKAA